MSLRVVIILMLGTLATVLLAVTSNWLVVIVSMLTLLGGLGYLAARSESSHQQLANLQHLQSAYDQLDQQTKLIIRTDMELHRTQEELDRKLASLMALHELGQQLEVSQRPEDVFGKLNATTVTNFGFSNGLLGMCPSADVLEWGSLVGVDTEKADALKAHLTESQLLKQILAHPAPTILSVLSTTDPARQRLLALLNSSTLVVAGVKPHTGLPGCLLLGRTATGRTDERADEELVGILTKQLATAVENSTLFEGTWTAQQKLERKVQQRTRELADANAQLVRLNNAKSDFVSAVSHELRTPLAAIKGYAALLGGGQFGALSKPQHERIAKVEKHSDALTQLINNLLDIARIESGRTTMERQMIEVEDFLSTVHDLVHPQLDAKHLRYDVNRNGITHLYGDTQQIQRVFVNLLSNAIKYTPEKGAIRVRFKREGSTIVVTVTDTGCGIAAQDLPKLFQEFYRVNDAMNQRVRGTGLGLALVKRIVEAHDGTITVSSEKGNGTTFTVRLPATVETSHAQLKETS